MQFISIQFIIAFFVIALLYYFAPRKLRPVLLLAANVLFFASFGPGYCVWLLLTIASTFAAGRSMESKRSTQAAGKETSAHADILQQNRHKKQRALALCLILNIGILVFFKTSGLWTSLLPTASGGSALQILMPIGISFYTLQALSYLIDCYHDSSKVCKSFVNYALYVSFFPLILAGPIERADHMIPQFEKAAGPSWASLREGFTVALWGYFLKMVLADRIAIYVDTVYASPGAYAGAPLLLAILLYSLQIYCDFYGYSCIALGCARILGFNVIQNFASPYLSGSVAEFWRRWHISLSSWLRDYVYIPLGGNRKGRLRKFLNILVVFLVSGFWHGTGLTFLIWGLLHGLYQVIGSILMPLRDKTVKVLHVSRTSFSHRLFRGIVTFLLVTFAWVFFRANTIKQAFELIHLLFKWNPWRLWDKTLTGILSAPEWHLVLIGLMILLIVDVMKRRGRSCACWFLQQGSVLRWIVLIAGVLTVLTCGVWGPGYNVANFIYMNF